jgi:deoxycytidylate deaminase
MNISLVDAEKDVKIMMDVCRVVSRYSSAVRAQVGAVVMCGRQRNIISFGYNGMPAGGSNVCEIDGKTREEVVHAEINALRKLPWWVRRVGWFRRQLMLGVTHAPCQRCARAIINAKIPTLYYLEPYGDMRGVLMLKEAGVRVVRVVWN